MSTDSKSPGGAGIIRREQDQGPFLQFAPTARPVRAEPARALLRT